VGRFSKAVDGKGDATEAEVMPTDPTTTQTVRKCAERHNRAFILVKVASAFYGKPLPRHETINKGTGLIP